jgi:ABC-type multidrug transport system fused ATPase/permease subunit
MSSKQKKNAWSIFKRLFYYITPYWETKAVIIIIVLTALLSVLSPAIIGNIIDAVGYVAAGEPIPDATGMEGFVNRLLLPVADYFSQANKIDYNIAMLSVLSVSLIVFALLEGGLSYMQRYQLEIISQRAGFDMRNDMYNSLLEQSFSFYDQQRTGQLMARATGDINMLGRFFNFGFRLALSNLLLLILIVYSMISISLRLTLVSIVENFDLLLVFTIFVPPRIGLLITCIFKHI